MADWFLNLPVLWMASMVFVATFLIAGGVYLVVTRLTDPEWCASLQGGVTGLVTCAGSSFAL